MAIRPVFQMKMSKPYCAISDIEFKYYSGFSTSQKQKSIESLHEQYLIKRPEAKLLEISSKSKKRIGVELSAFNLKLQYRNVLVTVECAFQGSKAFELGGPYGDIYSKTSYEAKKDNRLRESGKLIGFVFEGVEYPLEPKDSFYNWIYMNALHGNRELAQEVLQYDSFTDIEFNPQKSINCQAKAVAIYVGLTRADMIDKALESFETFRETIYST